MSQTQNFPVSSNVVSPVARPDRSRTLEQPGRIALEGVPVGQTLELQAPADLAAQIDVGG